MTDTIREQILAIRDSGRKNMLNTHVVQRIAYENGYYELVCYIEEYKRDYVQFF